MKSKSECSKIKTLVPATFVLEGIHGRLHLFPVIGYNFI